MKSLNKEGEGVKLHNKHNISKECDNLPTEITIKRPNYGVDPNKCQTQVLHIFKQVAIEVVGMKLELHTVSINGKALNLI